MKKLIIDKRTVKSNLQQIKGRTGGAVLYADLSSDAYGMGLLETARLLSTEIEYSDENVDILLKLLGG